MRAFLIDIEAIDANSGSFAMRLSLRFLPRFLAICPLAFPAAALAPVSAAAQDAIVGSWAGVGVARPVDSAPENVSCRVRYAEGSGRTFEVEATCAHTHGTFEQTGRVVSVGGNRYTGRMYNAGMNAEGDVVVTVSGNRQTVNVRSSRGTASVTLTRRGD